MDFFNMQIAQIAKRTRRERWGKGLCVVTRDPLKGNRLNVLTFANQEALADYVRRAKRRLIRIVAVV